MTNRLPVSSTRATSWWASAQSIPQNTAIYFSRVRVLVVACVVRAAL
ncbi:hypothetical protein [Nocardiopsis synnemataformans]